MPSKKFHGAEISSWPIYHIRALLYGRLRTCLSVGPSVSDFCSIDPTICNNRYQITTNTNALSRSRYILYVAWVPLRRPPSPYLPGPFNPHGKKHNQYSSRKCIIPLGQSAYAGGSSSGRRLSSPRPSTAAVEVSSELVPELGGSP
ncbi:hypothetical protein M407DRAFT_122351 [Tulasnella calospora MUT 4182]|uniref:Uncharacterized protein n=1 Tax=Tulasnella calospora MUT 4182 TaxID=1051891 RepID=A0A0C3KKR2_9AGAM|nr:hypothetical protein M407DRAFT_122351 [Tulasnella calospora MUT 4182]